MVVFFLVQVIVGLIGAFGNVSCIYSFSRKQNLKNFHRLMLSTAVAELVYITAAILLFATPQLAPR